MIDSLLHMSPVGCATDDISVNITDEMLSTSVVYLRVRRFVFSIFVGSVCACVCCSFQYVIIYLLLDNNIFNPVHSHNVRSDTTHILQ